MAYYDPSIEENQDPNAPQQLGTGPQSGVISGQGSSAAPSTPSSTNAPNAPDKPGNFVGIQQYLDQNKPQAANLAKDVGNYVTSQGTAASQAIAQGQGQFDQAVDQNTVKLNDDLFNEAKATPEKVAADAQKKADFQKMRDAQYQGPSSLEDSDYYQPINLAVQNALGTAKNTESPQGRIELLTDFSKQKNERVSRGASNLDAALLSASPDSRQILQQARDQINPLQDQLPAIAEAENAKVKAAQDQTAKTQAAIQAAFSGDQGVQSQLEAALKNKATQAQQDAAARADAALQALNGPQQRGRMIIGGATDQDLQELGLTRTQYNGLIADRDFYNQTGKASPLSNLASFATIQSPQNQITAQNIASADDYARYSALNDLMGTSNGFLSDPSQAGKANLDTVDFRYADTPNALADRVNSISFPQRGLNVPQSITSVNNWLNNTPDGAAHLAVQIAQDASQYSNNPKSSAFAEDVGNDTNMLGTAQNGLSQINKAYGTNFQVPSSYVAKAEQAIRNNLSSVYNSWASPYKTMPSDAQISQAAQTAAAVGYLNDIKGDISKVRV